MSLVRLENTAAGWLAANTTPAAGAICRETDTFQVKIGDGATAYNTLGYVTADQSLDELVGASIIGAAVAAQIASQPKTALFNATSDTLRLAKIGAARAGTGGNNMIIKCVGDSVTNGYMSSGWLKTYPEQLANILTAKTVLPSRGRGFQKASTNFTPGDPNQTLSGSGWTTTFGFGPNSSGTGGTWTIGPITTDNIDLYLDCFSAGSTATVTIDGSPPGSNATITMATGSLRYKVSYPVTQGSHTLVLTVASGSFSPLGYVGRSGGATGGAVVHHLGFNGTKSSDVNSFTNNTSTGQLMIDMLPADLTLIMYADNDYNAQLSLATYTANLTAGIARVRSTGGDPMLMLPPPFASTAYTGTFPITIDAYRSAAYQLATAQGCALLDLAPIFNTYAISQPLGLYGDTIHPSDYGYYLIASALYQSLASLGLAI